MRRALWVVLSLLWLAPASARAQSSGSEASLAGAARDLYQQGLDAAREDRLDDAIELFERSYALAPRDATVLNLAAVEEQDGRLVAAIDSYRRFLATASPDVLSRHGERARAAIAALEPRVAHLTLATFDVEDRDEVRLDGVVLDHASFGLDLPVDPGAHVVTVHRGEDDCGRQTVTLVEGGRRDVEVRAACPPPPLIDEAPVAPAPHADDPTPWVVLGVGGGAAVIAAIVAGIVLATSATPEPTPFVGNVGAGTFVIP